MIRFNQRLATAAFLVSTSFGFATTTDTQRMELGAIADTSSSSVIDTAPLARAMGGAVYWGEIGERGGLSVAEVVALAMKANPNLGTYEANRCAAQAELIKALQYPNPSIDAEWGRAKARETDENGDRPKRTTYDIALSQPIELPGKRLARRVEAEAGFAVVEGERLEFLTALRADVVEAYFTVQYHAALEKLHSSQLAIAKELEDFAKTRVEIGDAGRVEALNTRVEVLKGERELKAAQRRKLAARAALDALTGGRLGRNFRLSEGFQSSSRPALQSAVESAVNCHPRLVRLAAELEQRYATLDRARTEWWPDVKVGVRKGREFDADSAAATLGIEIPLWNRNQGGVARAKADAQKTYNDIIIALTELRRDAISAWQNLELAREQISSYEGGIRSASEDAIALAYENYRLGAVGFFEVLIARRNFQEAQSGYIQAMYDAAIAQARLIKAMGKTDK